MAFCINCGQELITGAKFCNNCGASIGVSQPKKKDVVTPPPVPNVEETKSTYKEEPITERKTVYDGEVHKCPNCGETLEAFVAKCPACGFELSRKKVSSVLQKFIDEINECERNVASSPSSEKTGWASWGKGKRFWWVVLNLFFMCIPLVIYLVLPLILINATPKLSSEEKKLSSVIENFPFPNDRESILAALVFAKDKVDFISKEKIDRKSAYWMRLWCSKAEQLKNRADMLFPNDNIVKHSYAEILDDQNRVKKTIKIKAVIGIIILIAAIIFSAVLYSPKSPITNNTPFNQNEILLRDHFPETEFAYASVMTNSKEEAYIYDISCSQSEFYNYVTKCKDFGYDYEIIEEDEHSFTAYNQDGYKLDLSYISTLSITIEAPMPLDVFTWPQSEIAKLIPVPNSNKGKIEWEHDYGFVIYVGDTTYEEYKSYVDKLYNSGFNVDYSKGDNHFYADNKKGYHVSVKYEGFNIMWLRLDEPED